MNKIILKLKLQLTTALDGAPIKSFTEMIVLGEATAHNSVLIIEIVLVNILPNPYLARSLHLGRDILHRIVRKLHVVLSKGWILFKRHSVVLSVAVSSHAHSWPSVTRQ